MRLGAAAEADMPSFPRADRRQRRPEVSETRLSPAASAAVIIGLSALSWAVLIATVVALRALL